MPGADGTSPPSGSDGPQRSPRSGAVVRKVLLGRHGPYADPRVALDALDDLEVLVAGLDDRGVLELAATLIDLVSDDDAVVATGATLALDVVRRHQVGSTDRLVDVVARMVDLVMGRGAALDRPPVGFAAASQATLRAELAVIAARSASTATAPAMEAIVERAASIEIPRADVVAALAERLPALVVARARTWVGPQDSAVVARLAEHHQRVAVASAVRPWSEQALAAIELAGRWQQWHEAEIEALLRVMRDDAPELTAPRGVGDVAPGGRWWIVAERPWDWTLWRSDDGRALLERVEGGVGVWTSVRLVTGDEAAAIVDAAVTGVELTGRTIVSSLRPPR